MSEIRASILPRLALVLCVVATLVAGNAAAQRLTRRAFVDEQNGYEFQPPDRWEIVPVQPGLAELGVLARIESGDPDLDLLVLRSATDAEGERVRFLDRFARLFGASAAKRVERLEEEDLEISRLAVRHAVVRADELQGNDVLFDVWSYPLRDHDVELVFSIRAEDKKVKLWKQTFARSARTFAAIEAKTVLDPGKHASYASILAFHQEEASRTPGWRALPTPSQEYVIKTSSDNARFLDEVIARLEQSRALYERDFPPSVAMDHVSVVRVCATREEFHRYGGTSGGVAGWFNPGTKELVLYDGKDIDRNMSYAVMSHEAFHQYCHFLFDQSEAHRWFDEGHGDYYGGAQFERGRAEITPRMPAGLDRLSVIREMVTSDTWTPLIEHLNFDHGQWQSQGPTNVSCYAQSWSIVYFLRQGVLGNVSRKVWREEYGEIIPNYVKTLLAGFQDAYREAREEALAEAAKESGGGSVVLGGERPKIGADRKRRIWEDAYTASWGQVDLAQLEQDWLSYVKKYLE